MKKNLFKLLILVLGVMFTVGCEMTLSFNDYHEAREKTRTTTQTTTNGNNATGGSNDGSNTINSSNTVTTKGADETTTKKSSSTNMTRNVFDVVLITPFGQTHTITVERWNNENLPEEFREGFIMVFGEDQYQIVGYYEDANYQTRIDLETAKIENNIDIYVKFEKIEPLPDKVTITYESNGGVETQAIAVDRGTKIASNQLPQITKLATDTKKFIFGGWYYDVDYVSKVNSGDTVNQDTKIYAKWREVVREGLYEYTESEDLTEWYITAFIGKEENTPENLVFPTTFNSKPVTKIQYASISKNNKIKTIEVPEGYTEFNAHLTKLSQFRVLTLASTLTSIDIDDNLRDCYRLVEVYNKSNVDLLGANTTYNYVHVIHTSMSEPSIIRQVGNYELAISDKGTYIIGTSEPIPANGELVMPQYITVDGQRVYGYHIGAFLYYQNSEIKKVTISKSIASVGQYSFSENENLEVVEINSVCEVLYGAFYNNKKLKTTFLGASNIHFETLAFQDWYMEKVFAPSFFSWTTYKFDNYDASPMGYGYASLYLEDSSGTESYTFDGITKTYKKFTDLVIPEGTKEIGDYQFYNFRNLTDFSIPNSLEKVGRYAFGLNGVYGDNSQLLTRTKVSNYNYTYSIKNGALVDSTYMYIGNSSNPYLMYIGVNPFTTSNIDLEVINIKSGCKFIDANSIHRSPASMPDENQPHNPSVHLTVNVPASVIQILAGAIRVRDCYLYVEIDRNSQMTDIDALAFELEDYSDFAIILPVTIKRIRGDYYNIDRWSQVYFYGTREQWEAVEVVRYNQQYRDPYMYYYSATKPTWPEDFNGWYGFWYWGTYNGNPCIEYWQRD